MNSWRGQPLCGATAERKVKDKTRKITAYKPQITKEFPVQSILQGSNLL
jgi:hypothetical protein